MLAKSQEISNPDSVRKNKSKYTNYIIKSFNKI